MHSRIHTSNFINKETKILKRTDCLFYSDCTVNSKTKKQEFYDSDCTVNSKFTSNTRKQGF